MCGCVRASVCGWVSVCRCVCVCYGCRFRCRCECRPCTEYIFWKSEFVLLQALRSLPFSLSLPLAVLPPFYTPVCYARCFALLFSYTIFFYKFFHIFTCIFSVIIHEPIQSECENILVFLRSAFRCVPSFHPSIHPFHPFMHTIAASILSIYRSSFRSVTHSANLDNQQRISLTSRALSHSVCVPLSFPLTLRLPISLARYGAVHPHRSQRIHRIYVSKFSVNWVWAARAASNNNRNIDRQCYRRFKSISHFIFIVNYIVVNVVRI